MQKNIVLSCACIVVSLGWSNSILAVPSFARQTGVACEACHTVYPQLTHFGRMFKANGYTLDNLQGVRDISMNKEETLSLTGLPPISLMIQASETSLDKAIPESTGAVGNAQNGTVSFPQQISLFYSGKIAPHVGAFVQLTYGNDSGQVGIDNTELRYANSIVTLNDQKLTYGVSINNNPTMQDLWNSTPAFGFPYASSNAAVSPLAATQIDGTLGQDVAGVSIYALWKEALYGELGMYRSAKQGAANPITGGAGPLDGSHSNVVAGVAPYYRLAYEHQWGRSSLEFGIYGANFKLHPGGGTSATPASLSGSTNSFNDVAEDFQYEYVDDKHIFTLSGTHIHESMNLTASAPDSAKNDLTTSRVWASYYYKRKVGGTLGYFATTGSDNPTLYSVATTSGVVTSLNGKPDTQGWMTEFNYMPWLNTRLALQYTTYQKFNGSRNNYDGFGRNAAANNTLYILLWVAY